MPLPGYHGRYLRVDLSARTSTVCEISDDVLAQYIGGTGLGTWLLLRECPAGTSALAPEAPLIFVFSPLVGSPLTTSAKFAVVCKSPLTGFLNDSLSSSGFAISGKNTGHDAIVIVGRATEPTVLVVDENAVRLEPAGDLWGQTIPQTADKLGKRLDTDFRTAIIGPAGENGVRYATISNDGRHAGRGGSGAVMGSRNLKALAVRGNVRVQFADAANLQKYAKELSRKSFGPATEKYRELGTVSNLLTFNRLGTLPTRNFQAGTFEGAEQLAPESMAATFERTRSSCAACTIGCEHIFKPPGKSAGVRMEYENLFALGPLCGVNDPNIVLRASQLCDEFGMDTISTGATIAFAMECSERGLIDQPGLQFGNGPRLLELIDDIAARRDFGDLLANGSKAAAASIQQGSDKFAPHVKGLEIPGYEPRTLQNMALGFAVNPRGADHNRSGAYQVDFSTEHNRFDPTTESVQAAIQIENEAVLMDSLILCKFLRGVFTDKLQAMSDMLKLVTGRTLSVEEMTDTAAHIVTAKKRFNVRHGWRPEDDCLPARFTSAPIAGPITKSDANNATDSPPIDAARLQTLIQIYNRQRGWSADGFPPA